MKKNEKRKLWKQGLGTALVCGLAVAVFPAAKADAADLLKAGPINTTAEHVTQNQPFAERTAGSQYFRIPAFIVTQKGNLLAAADARYSTTGDGGGLDTIASVSTDNGKTWNYSFPLYFPDSDGYIGNTATTIIDPALVQGKDGEIYCIGIRRHCPVYPICKLLEDVVCEYEIIPFADNVPVQIISILFKGLNIRSRKVLILRHLLPIQIVGKIREQIHYML